mmetsp:Transcript_16950/g.35579  ORF Transcript_16950/g.35579 Transcript_16950/m.35579 type:complete len:116 (-) Transcript_16950:809-1156(-)
MHHLFLDTEPTITSKCPTKEGRDPNPPNIIGHNICHAKMVKSSLTPTSISIHRAENNDGPEGRNRSDFEAHTNVAKEKICVEASELADCMPRGFVYGLYPGEEGQLFWNGAALTG